MSADRFLMRSGLISVAVPDGAEQAIYDELREFFSSGGRLTIDDWRDMEEATRKIARSAYEDARTEPDGLELLTERMAERGST